MKKISQIRAEQIVSEQRNLSLWNKTSVVKESKTKKENP